MLLAVQHLDARQSWKAGICNSRPEAYSRDGGENPHDPR